MGMTFFWKLRLRTRLTVRVRKMTTEIPTGSTQASVVMASLDILVAVIADVIGSSDTRGPAGDGGGGDRPGVAGAGAEDIESGPPVPSGLIGGEEGSRGPTGAGMGSSTGGGDNGGAEGGRNGSWGDGPRMSCECRWMVNVWTVTPRRVEAAVAEPICD